MPKEVSRKKALASSIDRSELLTRIYQVTYRYIKGHQDLYLHPLSFSGVMDEADIEPLQERLSKAKAFNCYHLDRYEEYPMRTLEQFKELHQDDVRGINSLTEDEYKYATQIAIWSSCGQLSVPGTSFTAGRASLVEPTADAQKICIFDSVVAMLKNSDH